jgi:hypothetical protein
MLRAFLYTRKDVGIEDVKLTVNQPTGTAIFSRNKSELKDLIVGVLN